MISQHNKSGLRNPWLLGMIGLIVLVLGVNGTFIWLSASHRATLVERDYNAKDRKSSEAALKEIGTQQALAWRTDIKKPVSLKVNSPAAYQISVADRDGVPVSGGTMAVEAYRAADGSKDFSTAFEEVTPGNYRGYISFPLKGYWELRVRIKRGPDEFAVNTQRFFVAADA
ncbi:MAG: FixH family protein [Pseudomonadota bacterium]|jgi:nitrogen fixation protein FixH